MNLKDLGNWGEWQAERHLKRNGAKVLARNYRALGAEIDRIVQMEGRIVFVEVKTRSGSRYGTPAEAVTRTKQQHILRAARFFLKETGRSDARIRFDVVEVSKEGVRHIPGAFVVQESGRY
ncbi:MAG: YraN family protein [Clostridia bacterium]|nr:YraN family protein [Clostridia bacterium]